MLGIDRNWAAHKYESPVEHDVTRLEGGCVAALSENLKRNGNDADEVLSQIDRLPPLRLETLKNSVEKPHFHFKSSNWFAPEWLEPFFAAFSACDKSISLGPFSFFY